MSSIARHFPCLEMGAKQRVRRTHQLFKSNRQGHRKPPSTIVTETTVYKSPRRDSSRPARYRALPRGPSPFDV
eukprot:1105931-Amphidinium_carterae.1